MAYCAPSILLLDSQKCEEDKAINGMHLEEKRQRATYTCVSEDKERTGGEITCNYLMIVIANSKSQMSDES